MFIHLLYHAERSAENAGVNAIEYIKSILLVINHFFCIITYYEKLKKKNKWNLMATHVIYTNVYKIILIIIIYITA